MSSRPGADVWPDWRGSWAVIVATGPSARLAHLFDTMGRAKVIAIKSSWWLCPWADVLYGSDRDWWVENKGVPEYLGLKVTASPSAAKLFGLRVVRLKITEKILPGELGAVGCGSRRGGGHSGFHALNLAAQFGATRISLVGMDMSNGHSDTDIHKAALHRAIEQLAGMGVTVGFGL